jgi:type VI secretion system protein ImpK
MSDDPFGPPDDSERTVIRPRPGGRPAAPAAPVAPSSAAVPPRQAAPAQPPPFVAAPAPAPRQSPPPMQPAATPPRAAAPPPRPSAPIDETPPPAIPFGTPSGSPLAAAAVPLLQLLAAIGNVAHRPDPADLYERTTRALRHFEQRAREGGVPTDQIRLCHFALCASVDDKVLNTPWGSTGMWVERPLALAFHQDNTGGRKFFELLERLRKSPDKFMPVIEVMSLCLSLGMMGPFRSSARGVSELDRVRAETSALIVAQKPAGPDLSPHWEGVNAPYVRKRGGVPVWVGYAAALAVVGALFAWVSTSLNAASDAQYARMLAAPPAAMPQITRAAIVQPPPPPPPPPEPTVLDRLAAALKPDIDSGMITLTGTAATPIVRVSYRNGFASARAVVQPPLATLLDHVGQALKNEPGKIDVIGYTDNEPVRTVQFPSNFQLSKARAQAAAAALGRALGDPGRISAEGRADADPIAPNTTAEGREQNRRIEIVLHRQA